MLLILLIGCADTADTAASATTDTASFVDLDACIAASSVTLSPLTDAPDEIVCPSLLHDEVYFQDQRIAEKIAEELGGDPEQAAWLTSLFAAIPTDALLETGCIDGADLSEAVDPPITLRGTVAEAAGHVLLDEMFRLKEETGMASDAHVVFALWNTDGWTGGVVAAYDSGRGIDEQSEASQPADCYEQSCADGFDLSPYIKSCELE